MKVGCARTCGLTDDVPLPVWITPDGLDTEEALPAEFFAVTATTIVPPTSAAWTTYDEVVSPAIVPQEAPLALQRRHS